MLFHPPTESFAPKAANEAWSLDFVSDQLADGTKFRALTGLSPTGTFRLYDTATRSVRAFEPVKPGRVSVYHCGLTVQSAPHLGHIRKEVTFDVLRRWLTWSGYRVTVIANITDIDDKILAKSAATGVPWWAHAYRFERELHEAYAALGCEPPTYEPRATGHIPEMIELIKTLIERGHAYPAADDSGDVYFDVLSWPAYGSLSGQRIEEIDGRPAEEVRRRRVQIVVRDNGSEFMRYIATLSDAGEGRTRVELALKGSKGPLAMD